jgi:excisionase family DNA binding protein
MPHKTDLLTVAEAAEIARCSTATIRRRIRDRELPASKHHKILRIDRRDLNAFLSKSKR